MKHRYKFSFGPWNISNGADDAGVVIGHLANSRKTFLRLVEKVRAFDEKKAQMLITDRNYQALDQMVNEHLLGL